MNRKPTQVLSNFSAEKIPQEHSPSHLTPSSFLKQEINKIIKEQLKTYGLKGKLEADLQIHHRRLVHKQLLKSMFDEKIGTYKIKEQMLRRKKQEDYLRKQQQRQQRLKYFNSLQRQSHHSKFADISQSLAQIKHKHDLIVQDDNNFRLNKLGLMNSISTLPQNSRYLDRSPSSRAFSTRSQKQQQTIRQMSAERENHLVTNYLTKVEHSESRILMKELDNEKRIKTSKSSRVKCFVQQRNKQEIQAMDRVEKEYRDRMGHFQANREKVFRVKQGLQMQRSSININKSKMAAYRRSQIHSKIIDQGQSRLQDSKQNLLHLYKSSLDESNDRKAMQHNLWKMREEERQAKLEGSLKLLYQKLQRIRNVKYGQKLDQNSLRIVLSALDKNDPQFVKLSEFLHCQRRSYLEGVIKKEEEKAKFDKTKKSNKILLGKTTTL